jgi:hypothetical protein
MTQAGGPAAINGFLYQIIRHLGWLADVSLRGALDGAAAGAGMVLVLEPRTGGDARAEAPGFFLVEQYKTRPGGTWAVGDLEAVLRDLRKSVPATLPEHARYRFVTDGRAGRLDALMAFLDDVKRAQSREELNDSTPHGFGSGLSVTNRGFFDRLAVETRSAGSPAGPGEEALLFHLLRRFELEFDQSNDAQAAAIEGLLRKYAPDLGDERHVREQLVGLLFEKLSRGEARLDAVAVDGLLRQAGLSPDRLRRMALLPEMMKLLTRNRLGRLRYRKDTDVRPPPDWPVGKPVILIAGDSGSGKTWQLGRLLEALADAGQVATLVVAERTAEPIMTRAARDLWQHGLRETTDKTLDALAQFRGEMLSGPKEPWLTVAADDIQDVDVARELVRQDWEAWGVRLAMTVPVSVARALELTDREAVHEHRVHEFSVDQLDALLRQTGRRWADLPADLKRLLRSPILAGLYVDLPYASVQTAPRSEYEIFERFWERIAARGHGGDEGIVLALAGHMQAGGTYPLPRRQWSDVGLDDDDQLTRLEAAGWLRCAEGGELLFAHVRLLNWAVAKWLARRYERREISIEQLAAFLLGRESENAGIQRQLAYVPMDALWQLTRDRETLAGIAQLVALFEESNEYGSYGTALYNELLPTLGQRAVPVLLERLAAVTAGQRNDYRVGLVGNAFSTLARQEAVDLHATLADLLNSASEERQSVAIHALTSAPSAAMLDRLWEIHVRNSAALEPRTNPMAFRHYEASFEALRAGTAVDPEWLRRRILAADPGREPAELAYLLNTLEHPSAGGIWRETSHALFEKVSHDKPRSLLNGIARFADRSRIDFVIACLRRSEDFANGAALAALTALDPAQTIDRLVEVGHSEREVTRNGWLPALLHLERVLTQQRIFELAGRTRGRRLIEALFWERPDDIDPPMLRLILEELETDLQRHFDAGTAGETNWLHHSFDFLARIARPELLETLQEKAGDPLERLIAEAAASRLGANSRERDSVLHGARRILILMAGEGISALINRELQSEHFWVRHGGLNWAFLRSHPGTIERLSEIALRPLPRDAEGKPGPEADREFGPATTALAALGMDAPLIEAIWSTAGHSVSPDLAWLRPVTGPMEKAITARAAEVLGREGSNEEEIRASLAVAWLSADPEFIPAVRSTFAKENPESALAGLACIALRALGDESDEFAALSSRLLQSGRNTWIGIDALLRLGERGLLQLEIWLKSGPGSGQTREEELVIRELYGHATTRTTSIDAANRSCLTNRAFLAAPYDIAAEDADQQLRERIFDQAFAARSVVTTRPLNAIRGLAKFDSARAIEAIELGLTAHPQIERELCELLVQIAPESAAATLVNAAVTIDRGSLPRTVGRVLRRLDPGTVAPVLIQRMAEVPSVRAIAVELAGWISTPEVRVTVDEVARHETVPDVRRAAWAALDRQRNEDSARELLAAFPTAPQNRQWAYMLAILQVADAYLLSTPGDPLWLGHILTGDLPPIFTHYVQSEINARKQRES